MLDYAHPEWYFQLVENFDVYLHAKNNLVNISKNPAI